MEHVKIVVRIYLWMEVRKNIDGIPVPEVWGINCKRDKRTTRNTLEN